MKKSDKKTENILIEALTEVCETALDEVTGFRWLTHFVNYSNFPESLSVVCVFDTNDDLTNALRAHNGDYLRKLIQEKFAAAGIRFTDLSQRVTFDTEEACRNEQGGKWSVRFNQTRRGKLVQWTG